MDDVLLVAEVAEYLRLHRVTVYRMIRSGKFPAFRVGSEYRVSRRMVVEWLGKQERGARGWRHLTKMEVELER